MKRLVRKMTLCLTFLSLAMGSANAFTKKVYATFDEEKVTHASNSEWLSSEMTFTWSQGNSNAINNIGLPSGDITKYEKLVVDCEIQEGTMYRVLFYSRNNGNTAFIVPIKKESGRPVEIILSEVVTDEDYLLNCSEICLSGGNWESPNGKVKVNEVYLETFDDGVRQDFATFENVNNGNWNAEARTFKWTTQYGNQLRSIGLPNGDLTKFKKLVVDCEIRNANQFRILFYQDNSNQTLYVKQGGVTEFLLAEESALTEDMLRNCSEVCLSGSNIANDTGTVVVNSIYLETYPNDESYNDILLTKDMFVEWNGVGADAEVINTNIYPTYNLGIDTDMLYGHASVVKTYYADLTDYEKIIFKGTEGTTVRALFNRQVDNGPVVEKYATIDGNGRAEMDLTDIEEYAHLNAVKLPGKGVVNRIMLVEKPRHLVIDDDRLLDLDAEEGVSYASVIYNRIITANKYGTICLPFAPDATSLEAYNFYELTASTVNGTDGEVTFTKVDAPEANKPYIYRLADDAVEGTAITCGATEVSAEAGTTSIGLWEMVGSFTNQVVDCTGKAIYALNGATQKLMKVTQTLTVPPYRAYIQGVGNSINETPQSLTVRISGPTGIEQISAADVEGLLPATIYDLMGRPVQNPQKGHLYIQGGKKIVY